MASKSSRILIIGSTGHIGRYIAKASIAFGHPTFLLVRESTTNSLKSEKAKLLESFESAGANILHVSTLRFQVRADWFLSDLMIPCTSFFSHAGGYGY
jgi:nucleoside-diphosphate-sugar epimerase